MKIVVFILFCFCLFSCSTYKNIKKKDNTVTNTVVKKNTITRPGDTITIDIPNVRYYDTIIKRVNYENKTIAKVTYDSSGNQKFECLSAELIETMELIRQDIKNDINVNSEKKNDFKPQNFIYAIVVLVIALIVFMVFLNNKFNNILKSLLDK